jgi:tetratricopeptide (TPR) repeat protein
LCISLTLLLLGGLILSAQSPSERLRSLVDRAQAAEQQDKLDEAVTLYEDILRIRPGWASAELNLGLVYHSRAEYDKAVQLLTKALQHNPSLHSALLFRGASYFHTGRFRQAVRDLKLYLRHKPDDGEGLSYLANSSLALNDPEEAALAFATLARISGKPSAYFQLSECYVQAARAAMTRLSGEKGGEYRLRIAADEKSPKPQPCAVPGHAELGRARCSADSGDFESATRTLMHVLQKPALSQQAIYLTVGAYARLAQAAVAKVIELAPESPWAALLRAQAAERAGEIERAESEYEKAAAAAEKELEVYVRFGQFQAKQGRFDGALVSYEEALKLEPQNPRVMGLIGEVHALQDRPEKAVSFLEAALKANPRETQTRIYLAQALIRLSRTSEAISILEAAPDDADGRVHYLLGRTYQQLGEAEKARKAMDEFRKRRNPVRP